MQYFSFLRTAAGLLSQAALLLGLTSPALAQTTPPADTTRLRYSEEVAAPPTPAAVPRAVRHQWKLGLNNFLINSYPFSPYSGGNFYARLYYTRVGLHLAYEQQLGRSFTVQAEASPALTYSRSDPSAAIEGGFALRAQAQSRYYYNLERRLRRGRRPSPFAANYFALALGTGTNFGGVLRETPNYLLLNRPGFVADVALLYGLQRRLGRYGFLDAAVGATGLLEDGGVHNVGLTASLRVGLALPEASRATAPVPVDEVTALLPRAYVGVQAGDYSYRVHYSEVDPFPANTVTMHGNERWTTYYPEGSSRPNGFGGTGYSTYTQYVATLPYVYAGYYLTPRLALQAGVQHEDYTKTAGGIAIDASDGIFLVPSVRAHFRDWAVPVQVRYALTRVLQRRFQADALAGFTPHWSAVELREYTIANHQVTDQVTYQFQRRAFGLHGSAGVALAYGLGRRRRVQAVAEAVLTKDLSTGFRNTEPLQGGASAGLRYRFGYH